MQIQHFIIWGYLQLTLKWKEKTKTLHNLLNSLRPLTHASWINQNRETACLWIPCHISFQNIKLTMWQGCENSSSLLLWQKKEMSLNNTKIFQIGQLCQGFFFYWLSTKYYLLVRLMSQCQKNPLRLRMSKQIFDSVSDIRRETYFTNLNTSSSALCSELS